MSFAESTELAFARTGRDIDADLPEENSAIVEASPGARVRNSAQERGLQRCLRKLQQKNTLVTIGGDTLLRRFKNPQHSLINVHLSPPSIAVTMVASIAKKRPSVIGE